jgi:rhamnosyltransferase
LIANADNLGLGIALNQGVRRVAELGFGWVLLFDQDSVPAPEMSARMIETLHHHPVQEQVAIIGVSYEEADNPRRHQVLRPHPLCPLFFQKATVGSRDLLSVSMVITSGSLLRMADFAALGPFDEGFFIDYIDTDFCLRCRRRGRLIAISAKARMLHSLGHREVRRWRGVVFYPLNHSALRHYYIARNRVQMWLRYGWRFPHWWLFDITFGVMNVLRVLIAERQRQEKLLAMIQGTWHGLRGRSGAHFAAKH